MFCGSIAASIGDFANGLNASFRVLGANGLNASFRVLGANGLNAPLRVLGLNLVDLEGRLEARVCRLERMVGAVSG